MQLLLTEPPSNYKRPQTDENKLADPYWRLNNLYTIINEDAEEIAFKMRPVQNDFYWRMWYLNFILKSRQHGFTTECCLIGLDKACFIKNYHVHFIAHTMDVSYEIFDQKIKDPFDKLIEDHRELGKGMMIESDTDNNRILRLNNGSSISAGQSMRGGTVQYLHISEYGKICASSPDKAKEIRTGSLNTVHPGNFVTIEGTAEGRSGDFYNMNHIAKAKSDSGLELSVMDFKFFFYGWHLDPKNRIDPRHVHLTEEEKRYFSDLKKVNDITTTPGQKAWYVKKQETQRDLMYREHPSTPEEAFQGTVERKTYGKILIMLRRKGMIQPYLPFEPSIAVDTTWDLGKNDFNSIWWHQWIKHLGIHRWLHYYENRGPGLKHYWKYLKDFAEENNIFYGNHYLPHDVNVSEQSMNKGYTRLDYLEEMGMKNIIDVERVPNLVDGLEATKQMLEVSQFSESGCKDGVVHLEEYEAFEFDERLEDTKETRSKHKHSNAADAIRQLAQDWEDKIAYRSRKNRKKRGWKSN